MSRATTFVIPSWNSIGYLPRCIAALRTHAPDAAVIVVDNASSDGSADWLAANAPEVTLIRNDDNVGFGAACNQGVAASTTPWICLLNADAFITAGSLDALHDRLERIGAPAIAVPMFLNEDGSVQEAGAVLARDGRGAFHGFYRKPRDWSVRFPRRVDYGSAACWLLSRETFLDLGGFDVEVFHPAYYEDVDLCLRAADRGIPTWYEPTARVVHVRNVSGSPTAINELLVRNQARFVERWSALLARRPVYRRLRRNPQQVVAARDADRFERLLVLATELPDINDDRFDLRAVQRAWPNARITIACARQPSETMAMHWLAAGIEIATGHRHWWRWFRTRLAFYTTVLALDPDAREYFARFVSCSQVAYTAAALTAPAIGPTLRPANRWTRRRLHRIAAPEPTWTPVEPTMPLVSVLTSCGWVDPDRNGPVSLDSPTLTSP